MSSCFILPFTGYSMYPFLKPGDRLLVKHVSPNILQVGDIIIIPNTQGSFIAHRLIKIFPNGKGATKGDSLLIFDRGQVELSKIAGRVEVVIRGRRLIPISTGIRSHIKKFYALMSLMGLTYGALKLKGKIQLNRFFNINKLYKHDLERSFILSILKGNSIESIPELNWMRLTEIAHREGLAGILYLRLKGKNIPSSVISSFENYYHNTASLNLNYINALEKLEKVLNNEQIEVMIFKGASLLDNFYHSVGMRFMEDIDLMVHSSDRERFVKLLHHLGYQKRGSLSHLFVKDKVTIDLHTHTLHTDRIEARDALFPCGMEPLWASALPWKPGFRWIKRPENADHVLLLSQHLIQHSFSKLIWFEDIRRLLKNNNEQFWERLKDRAYFFMQQKSLAYTLYILKGLYEYIPQEESLISKFPDDISQFDRILLGIYRTDKKPDRLGVFLNFFSIPGFKAKIIFGWETLFPKKAVIIQEFGRISIAKRALFYPMRILQLTVLLMKLMLLIPLGIIRSI